MQKKKKLSVKLKMKRVGNIAIGIFVAAVVILSVFFPVLRIYGSSMSPTLADGDIAVAVKISSISIGDILVFEHNGKTLIRRCIAQSGDWVNIDTNGNVFVNNEKITEPYIYRKSIGECDISFPYQVPENSFFVMGDNRGIAVDSRLREIGCVSKDDLKGKLLFRLLPIGKFSLNENRELNYEA